MSIGVEQPVWADHRLMNLAVMDDIRQLKDGVALLHQLIALFEAEAPQQLQAVKHAWQQQDHYSLRRERIDSKGVPVPLGRSNWRPTAAALKLPPVQMRVFLKIISRSSNRL